ncbi:MAG: hypothetical protein BroJett038_32660 [Chloroflexota bacterium]|nr:MAG: hypothetical protein BroJett038_32660 [Chloroflexota bacterium]
MTQHSERTMSRRFLWIGFITLVAAVGLIVVVTAALIPQETHPAYAAALRFAGAVGAGDDETAFSLLSPAMQDYVTARCPDGSVSACVQGFIPPEWGGFISVVFRRAAPDGPNAFNVDLIATYEKDKGFSGVCIYHRLEQDGTGEWRVAGWAGYVSCGDPLSRNMAANADAPNRAP